MLAGLFFLFPLLLCTCDLWGSRDNPLDSGAANYQGYTTTTRADNIQLASSWEGVYDPSAAVAPTFTCSEVVGATAYELQVSADEIFESIVYQNDTLTTNSASAADLPDGLCRFETYWWRMRAYKDGWGAWSSARSFAYQPTSAVAAPALNVAAGAVSHGTVVTFTCETSGAIFYFTTDGSKPSNLSATGTSCTLTEAATLTVMAACSGMGNSAVTRAAYTIATSGVSLDKSSETIYVGDTERLVATVAPATATNQVVTWTSDNEAVATVSASGVVSAISAGGATITATTDDGGYTASCALTVEVGTRVTGVSLDQTEATVTIGSTTTLAATITPTDASNTSVTWASSDETVATVSGSGVVTGVAAGTATIAATTVNGGYTASCVVTVPPMAVSGVSLDKTTDTIAVGATDQLTATVSPANATNKNITWTSSNTAIAAVSDEGAVTGVAEGTATITVTTDDQGKTATCEVTVYIAVADISLNKSTSSLAVGATESLVATVSPANATTKAVTWSSSDASVATVTSSGAVTGVATGTATITATSVEGSKTANCIVNVYIAVTGVSLDKASCNIITTGTIQLTATVSPANAANTATAWTSSDTSIATVSSTGLVKGIAVGAATITATTVDGGFYDECDVTVINCKLVETGSGHTMLLADDGSLWATGFNYTGQLGDGTTISRSSLVKIMSDVSSVSAGDSHTMIVKTDASLWATGYNAYGQLGDGTTTDRSVPEQVMTGVSAVSAGSEYTMILKTDGSLWATGRNGYGALGDGTTINKVTPVQVMTGVSAVSAGYNHTMIVKTDGTLWATGRNSVGQLGDGTTTDRSTPVQVMTDVVSVVSAGSSSYTLYIKTDGSLWAMGYNLYGELGDGTTENKTTPVQIMTDVSAVAAGGHTMILKADGGLWATGRNDYSQLGDGTYIDKITPVQVMSGVSAVSTGSQFTMIFKIDGSLWAAGSNTSGQYGNGTTDSSSTPTQVF
jgi:uncharacterized protein YjdB